MIMTKCPFLSTYDKVIECFRECALYNCKSTGGVCPFKNFYEYESSKIEYKEEIEYGKRDFDFIKESYVEMHNQYL